MAHSLPTLRRLRLFALAVLALLAGFPLAAQETSTPEPPAAETAFGPGDFNLPTPMAGLADLASYRATLSVSFDGTSAGQPEQWSRTYTMLVTGTPRARQLTIDTPDDAEAQVYMAEVGGSFYERRDGGCIASPVETEGEFAAAWEPAGFLDSVIGAEDAGAETIDGLTVVHYTFDERAHGAAAIAESTGNVWVAPDGGYVVRYTLATMGGAAYFGAGTDGTIAWDYRLDGVNQPLAVELPADCPPPPLDVAAMPDAAGLFRNPGIMTYTTPSGLDAVLAFYEDLTPPSGPPLITNTTALLGFMHGSDPILLIADAAASPTSVVMYRMSDPAALAITEVVPDTAVRDEADATCADDIPVLEDASSLTRMAGLLSYMTSASVTDAADFYETYFTAQGGLVSYSMPTTNMMAMMNVQRDAQVMTILISDMGGTRNVTITSATLSAGAATLCDTD